MYIVIEPILVTPGVLFFLTWSFFPKEGFGQGGFNEAPLFNKSKEGFPTIRLSVCFSF